MGDGWVTLIDRFAAPYLEERRRFSGQEMTLKFDCFDVAARAMREFGLAGSLPRHVTRNVAGLKRRDAPQMEVSLDLFIIHHESRSNDPDIRGTVDWIRQELSKMNPEGSR